LTLVVINPLLQISDSFEGTVPAYFQLGSDQTVLWIGCVILPEGAIGGKARGFEVTR
jgi:hypothetical protein